MSISFSEFLSLSLSLSLSPYFEYSEALLFTDPLYISNCRFYLTCVRTEENVELWPAPTHSDKTPVPRLLSTSKSPTNATQVSNSKPQGLTCVSRLVQRPKLSHGACWQLCSSWQALLQVSVLVSLLNMYIQWFQ